jgi:hypothetical protein
MSNSSKDPQVMLNNALDRGYHRILFQQGEPVLDRELTLLGDLASPERLARSYLGNGVPMGDNGFAITNLFDNDFTVTAGRCLVGGREVRLAADTTYRTQRHTPNAAPLPAGQSNVYLHVFTGEVTATQDPDLANAGDVGMETSVREKIDWEIQLSPITAPINDADHLLLAVINPQSPFHPIEDHRRTGLTLAAVRDDTNAVRIEISAARGTAANLAVRLNKSLAPDGTLTLLPGSVGGPQLANDLTSRLNKSLAADGTLLSGSVGAPQLASDLASRLNKSLAPDGTLVSGSVGGPQLANDVTSRLDKSLAADGTLRPGSVGGPQLAPNAVSTAAIANGAVPLSKLNVTPVGVQISVAASPGTGQFHEEEVPIYTQTTLGHGSPFFLVTVQLIEATPLLVPFPPPYQAKIEWSHRVKLDASTSGNSWTYILVIRNFSSMAVDVGCFANILSYF